MKKAKPKRKSRNTLNRIKKDELLSIPLTDLGSENDPCFGKFYNPQAPECSRCGDSEFCAIAMGQNNHKLREKVEKEQAFLDSEEKNIPKKSKEMVKKEVKKTIVRTIKFNKNLGITHNALQKKVYDIHLNDGIRLEEIDRLIKVVVANPERKILNKKGKYYAKIDTPDAR